MAEYRLRPAAQGDLDRIFDYTVHEWGLDQAVRYTRSIETACGELVAAPLQGQDCSHVRAGYRRWAVDHHFVYFRVTDYGIAVIRILHEKMDATRHL